MDRTIDNDAGIGGLAHLFGLVMVLVLVLVIDYLF